MSIVKGLAVVKKKLPSKKLQQKMLETGIQSLDAGPIIDGPVTGILDMIHDTAVNLFKVHIFFMKECMRPLEGLYFNRAQPSPVSIYIQTAEDELEFAGYYHRTRYGKNN